MPKRKKAGTSRAAAMLRAWERSSKRFAYHLYLSPAQMGFVAGWLAAMRWRDRQDRKAAQEARQ